MTTLNLSPVVIMAGGTGGHVIPALSVAAELQQRGVGVEWLGTHAGIESKLVPSAGIRIHWLSISGFRGKGKATLLLAPFKLIRAVAQAASILRQIQPQAVLGMGGFASGPGGIAARLLGIRLVIHEQNAVAGMTNSWLAKVAQVVAYAFNGAFAESAKGELVGNPVRDSIAALPAPAERFAGRDGKTNILVIGGSQGAMALNQVVPQALASMKHAAQVQVRHQCGNRFVESAQQAYGQDFSNVTIEPFIDDMAEAYAWADLVVCRSGALTIAEVAAAGVGAIMVPFPYAVDDHQTVNAAVIENAGGGSIRQQSNLTAESLAAELDELVVDRPRLLAMAEASRSVAVIGSASRLADICLGSNAGEAS
ncbi:MAG: UDP-N-acetylglucosamine--N-acetylmuramyl-(pentapeptide) pyrophosphoryl-undecaprenol N-acetylglucosamine transferase [Gammaproteobacteria bacterium]|jgi:UDP-N-acetylglucosamine--N-acetylmuramyl-(pentapeptide) pyrophosphoryl-undecaprenol N-acetylglucosamine transferase